MLEISQIAVALDAAVGEAACLEAARRAAFDLLGLEPSDVVDFELRRRSIDARRRRDVHIVLSVALRLREDIDETAVLAHLDPCTRGRVRIAQTEQAASPARESRAGWDGWAARYPQKPSSPRSAEAGLNRRADRPVVVGAGCAGLFAALSLAEAGLEPLVIERGGDARARAAAIGRFYRTAVLDTSSNIQFGLGGAGTFSDGKLSTGTRSPTHRLILETLVAAGSPAEILWDAKPHIGSDLLPGIVERIATRIRKLGGEVRFGCRLTDIVCENAPSERVVRAIEVEQRSETGGGAERAADPRMDGRLEREGDSRTGDSRDKVSETCERIRCNRLILACGHSARDVFELLRDRGFDLERKTFAMGVRIEHRQSAIDRALFGRAAGHPALGPGSYRLAVHPAGSRSVFTFCMCPGGEVVAAASEKGGVVTNGASRFSRGGENANSALLANIFPADMGGDDPLAGVALQRRCERTAFELGGGAYRAPAQLVGDFLRGAASEAGGSVKPTYPLGVRWTQIDPALPACVISALRAGLGQLGRRLSGFDAEDAVLCGVETRSSSPVRITRDDALQALGVTGVFPSGEGAGYAGGIMSAAADGIRCAEALIASL
ncbi:FAD dependent oxidoreductase [Coriobacterium glomerans PW2]|uniref:FAD dependent oxidoreductase n=1 Tax=Coriobacterium glomerans (strain ATCC 49209 / DSM 20642 / JCM 10262 / PW2) TaxID=700015 RepID=F2N8I9_CORGP|nr:FAD-binding protein [Coriobacterium glomerans]AEB07372.1 FAD dependent oxidoreductase [Coriobacterium glomerans PW2]